MKKHFNLIAWLLFGGMVLMAQQPPPPQSQALSSVSASGILSTATTSIAIPLYGYGACAATINGNAVGFTLVPQTAADSPNSAGSATFTTNTAINSGSITSNGTYAGVVAPQGLTWFRLNLTGISSGNVLYTITCSNATSSSGSGGGGSGGNVTVVAPTDASGNVKISVQAAPTLNVNCVTGCTPGSLPFTGGATAQPTAAGQGLAVFGVNGSHTEDALLENGGYLGVQPILVGTNGFYAQDQPDQFIDTVLSTTAGTTQLIAANATKATFIRLLATQSTASNTSIAFDFVYSANSACSSANTVIAGNGTMTMAATASQFSQYYGGGPNNGSGNGVAPAPVAFVVPANNYICIITTGTTVNGAALIMYSQHVLP